LGLTDSGVKVIHIVELSLDYLSIWDGLYYRLHSERLGIWIYLNCRLEQFRLQAVHRSLGMRKRHEDRPILEAPSQDILLLVVLSGESQ
jgi:hypothetical protein